MKDENHILWDSRSFDELMCWVRAPYIRLNKVLAVVATILQEFYDDFLPSSVYVSLSKERHTREYSSMCFTTCL